MSAELIPERLRLDWSFVRALGEGGQGLALELRRVKAPHTAAALKVLNPKKLGAEHDVALAIERMRREIGVLGEMSHPNIAQLIDADVEPTPWHITPLGVPLKDWWQEKRRHLSPQAQFDASVPLIEGVLLGLAALHERHLVHRDVKPANIIVMDDTRPVLIDLGIVHVPEKERVTERPAGNTFARYKPSLYDPSDNPPFMDCFAAATLWAWMLAEDPKVAYGNFYWKVHRFIRDPRSEIARAVLAACSDDAQGPKDASVLLHLIMADYKLSAATLAAPGIDRVKSIVAIQQAGRARQDLAAAEQRQMIESVAASVETKLRWLRQAVRAQTDALEAAGLPVFWADARIQAGLNWSVEFAGELCYSMQAPEGRAGIFSVACGETPRVTAEVSFQYLDSEEDADRFCLLVGLAGGGRRLTSFQYPIRNGQFWDASNAPVEANTLAENIVAFLSSPESYRRSAVVVLEGLTEDASRVLSHACDLVLADESVTCVVIGGEELLLDAQPPMAQQACRDAIDLLVDRGYLDAEAVFGAGRKWVGFTVTTSGFEEYATAFLKGFKARRRRIILHAVSVLDGGSGAFTSQLARDLGENHALVVVVLLSLIEQGRLRGDRMSDGGLCVYTPSALLKQELADE